MVDRPAVAAGQRIVRHILRVSFVGRAERAALAAGVVAAEVMIIPHVVQRHVLVEPRLRGGLEHEVVRAAKALEAVVGDVAVMEIAGVHVEQRLALPDHVEDCVRRSGARTRREREAKRRRLVRLGKGAKAPRLLRIHPAVHLQSVVILRVRLEILQRERHHFAVIPMRDCGCGAGNLLQRHIRSVEQLRRRTIPRELRLD